MILLACAVEKELAFWKPRDGVDVLITGVGVVEAAIAVTHRLAQQRYKLIVNAGIAGAYEGAAKIGSGTMLGLSTAGRAVGSWRRSIMARTLEKPAQ